MITDNAIFNQVIDMDYPEKKPITQKEAKQLLEKFSSRIRGGVRLRHGKVTTVDSLEERRKKVENLP